MHISTFGTKLAIAFQKVLAQLLGWHTVSKSLLYDRFTPHPTQPWKLLVMLSVLPKWSPSGW